MYSVHPRQLAYTATAMPSELGEAFKASSVVVEDAHRLHEPRALPSESSNTGPLFSRSSCVFAPVISSPTTASPCFS